MNIDALWKAIGKPWNEEQTCVMPIYELFPNIPIFKTQDEFEKILPLFEHYCRKVETVELRSGDLLIFDFGKSRHFGVFAGGDRFFHITKSHKLRVSRLQRYTKWLKYCYRKI